MDVNINRNLDINLEKIAQKITNNEWATNLQVLGPYRCYSAHVSVPTHDHAYHPQVRVSEAPYTVDEEPNGELGPTTIGAWVANSFHVSMKFSRVAIGRGHGRPVAAV